MAELPQHPHFHQAPSLHKPVQSKSSRGQNLVTLLFGIMGVIALGVGMAEYSPEDRKLLLFFYAILAGSLLLLPWYLVRSYKKEKGRINPYDRDHIVK